MKKNMGTIDRLLRAVLGLVLLVAGFVMAPRGYIWLAIVAILPLGTSALGVCPVYLPFGISTVRKD